MEILKQSQKNNFDHLPDDVLRILNQLWDIKWICRCSIVSKRFASLIPHINNVSFKAPYHYSAWSEEEKARTSVFNYLAGLKDIVYLHLEEPFFDEAKFLRFPLFKWKIGEFNSNIKSFTFVKASWLTRVEDEEDDGEGKEEEGEEEDDDDEDEDEDVEDEQLYPKNVALACFNAACMRLNNALYMIKKHQMLRSITIADIKNQGKIVLSGDQIFKLRDFEREILLMTEVNSERIELLLKHCRLPTLRLPKSKFNMAFPTLVYIRWVNPSCSGSDDVNDDEMFAGSFDGYEGEVFDEAVKEILAKHKDKMNTEWINRG